MILQKILKNDHCKYYSHVSSMESFENLVFENRAKPPLYSHTFKGTYLNKIKMNEKIHFPSHFLKDSLNHLTNPSCNSQSSP